MTGLAACLLLGGLHGLVLAAVLRRRATNRRANSYLATLLVALALLLFDGFLRAAGLFTSHPHLIGLTAWVPFVLGPLVFLYVREMTAPEPARLAAPWRHFIVTAVYIVLLAVVFYPRSASYKLSVSEHDNPWFISVVEVGLLIYGIVYAIMALVLLRRHRGHLKAIYSNLRGVSLHWLLVLAVLNTLVWCAAFVAWATRITGVVDMAAASAIVPIGSTVVVFVTGYFQLGQAEIPHVPDPTPPEPQAQLVPQAPEQPPPAYARARLAEDDAAEVETRIRAAMTEKRLYQRAGLTLPELADEVAATPHEVSQVLSTRLGRNFYTFVNEHRIDHVKAGLTSSDRPVLDLAFEAGFQSKSTFNTAFRKATGMTPREYRQRPSS